MSKWFSRGPAPHGREGVLSLTSSKAKPGSTLEPRQGSGAFRLGLPFSAVHLGLLAIPFVGWSVFSLAACALLYSVRSLGITVFYHRGMTHRSFRMGRAVQAAGAVVATSAAQRGPLWWVAHHRTHHRHTDRAGDPHSPTSGLLWSHVTWMFARSNQGTDLQSVRDLSRFRELRLLDRFHHVVPVTLAAATFGVGILVGHALPGLGVTGPQLLVWAFCVSTVLLWHTTFAVNSLGHRIGPRRFETRDASRNLWWLALLTMGEGWHNNHHRFPMSARQGLARRELDPSWWLIRTMAALHLVTDVRTPSSPHGTAPGDAATVVRYKRRAAATL